MKSKKINPLQGYHELRAPALGLRQSPKLVWEASEAVALAYQLVLPLSQDLRPAGLGLATLMLKIV